MSQEEQEVREGPFSNSIDEDNPTIKDYVFKLRSGENKLAKGFLAVAAGFVAVGTSSGDLQLVVPLDNLHYAEELPAIQGQA